MAYENFIPEVWAEGINRELERKCVFAEDCNRQYEGDVKKAGDIVHILGVGAPTITTTTNKAITLSGPETVEDTSVIMPIRQIAYYNYKIDDIDKRQAVGGVMEALSAETSAGLASKMDAYIASFADAAEAVKLTAEASPTAVTYQNVLQTMDQALQKLYENDVDPATDITITVPPAIYMLMKQAYIDLDTRNSDFLKHGFVGMYGNAKIKMSNNVHKESITVSGTAETVYNIMVRTNRAIAFANPMTHVEAYRPEASFSDAVKGFILYDAKIVRPKEMVVANVYVD
jgi:hypothetical protein